jgi:hypothetical protein
LKSQVIDPIVDSANVGTLIGQYLNRAHYTRLVRSDAMYVSAETGRLVLMLVKQCLPKELCQQAYEHLRTVSKAPNNRGMAVAGKGAMMPGITRDGMLSQRLAVWGGLLAACNMDPEVSVVC